MTDMFRRRFMKGSVVAAGAATAHSIAGYGHTAIAAANERIQAGFVGAAGRAGRLLKSFASQPDVDVVAIADVDARRLAAAVEKIKNNKGKAPKGYHDFRDILDKEKIDVLVVGTPDH